MKFKAPIRLEDAAAYLGCRFVGSPDHLITGINEIHRVEAGDVVFVDVEKYYRKALYSAATTILINKEVAPPEGKGLLITEDPFRDYNRLATREQPESPPIPPQAPSQGPNCHIASTAVFGEDVVLGEDVHIGHGAVIGNHVRIGDHSRIHANVTVYDHSDIGAHCTIGAGSAIGSEAFYFKARPEGREKMISVGRTVIGDHVDIGANCTIDRGVSHETRIGDWTKIDNLVQVGHDTVIGKRCLIAAQVGIAGVVEIGNDVAIWGQVGVVQDLRIGDGAVLLGKTGVMSDLEGGKTYGGLVADDARAFLRKEAVLKKLIEIMPGIESLLKAKKEDEE